MHVAVSECSIILHSDIHISYRILMKLPKFCSASNMFADARIPDYVALIRSRVAAFWLRIRNSKNGILGVCSEYPDNPIVKSWLAVLRDSRRKP
ncbi:jg7201 [Pararge aegeria aegeria]|uniref:Jg7201 protein n=1 Tax=Pararge aegeria aegeria TaxID=348720 RepID=A0A8S4R6Y2_9NEOP|nr:jg7201 [Pararge aegeria aegeria]